MNFHKKYRFELALSVNISIIISRNAPNMYSGGHKWAYSVRKDGKVDF